jgi:hypothetical protein
MGLVTEKKLERNLGPLLPVLTGLGLLAWGCWVLYTAFAYGSLPVAGWRTESKQLFGLTWLVVFVVVLIPAYLYAISKGWWSLRKKPTTDEDGGDSRRLAAVGVSVLLVALTFCARVAVTAWFPVPMHPPFGRWHGGWGSGLVATMILLMLEAGVLVGIKHQTRCDQRPYPLLIPGGFALLLMVWAGWVAHTSFVHGSLPVVGWQTESPRLFGMLWLAVLCVVLLPAYLYAVFLGILGLVKRLYRDEVVRQNYWLVAIGNTALLCLITFCARLAVTAWFPVPMHPPLDQWQGGPAAGALATAVLVIVTTFYYRTARSF